MSDPDYCYCCAVLVVCVLHDHHLIDEHYCKSCDEGSESLHDCDDDKYEGETETKSGQPHLH